jgi:hypothetical protein
MRHRQLTQIAAVLVVFGATVATTTGCGGDEDGSRSADEQSSASSRATGDPEGSDSGYDDVDLSQLSEANPYPVPDPICGTVNASEPDERLAGVGVAKSASTFCGDESPVDQLGALQMADTQSAREFVDDQVILDLSEAVKTGQPERLGDVVCQSYTADGEPEVLCSAAVGGIVVFATGEEGASSSEIVDEGVAKLIAWVQGS